MLGALSVNAPAPPSTFDGVTEGIAVFVLLVVFVMLRQALLHWQVRLYALQSVGVSVLAAVLAANEHAADLYVLAGLSFVLKVIIVPAIILHLVREAEVDLAGSQRFGVATAVLLGVAVSVFAFLVVSSFHIGGPGRQAPRTGTRSIGGHRAGLVCARDVPSRRRLPGGRLLFDGKRDLGRQSRYRRTYAVNCRSQPPLRPACRRGRLRGHNPGPPSPPRVVFHRNPRPAPRLKITN